MALGEQHERMLQAQLGAPLRERHTQLVAEQTAQRALADTDPAADLLQRQGLGQVSAINAHACRNRRSVGEGTHSGSRMLVVGS